MDLLPPNCHAYDKFPLMKKIVRPTKISELNLLNEKKTYFIILHIIQTCNKLIFQEFKLHEFDKLSRV